MIIRIATVKTEVFKEGIRIDGVFFQILIDGWVTGEDRLVVGTAKPYLFAGG